MKRCFGQWLAFLGEQAMGVLDGHRQVVDENADRERQPAERHCVERLAQEIEHHERRQDRERDRDHHHQVDRQEPRTRGSSAP